MKNYNYICNVKKSVPDKRDYQFVSIGRDIPVKLDYISELQPVRDQGKQGSCYAQVASCVKEWQEKKDNGFDEYMSPQFFYNNRPNNHDDNKNNDDGMYGRDVMKLLKVVGICREYDYPYGKIEKRYDIPQSCFEKAKEYKIKTYASIKSIQSLKESLVLNGPCLITFPCYGNSLYFWRKNGKKKGGHAVTVVGYDNLGFIIRNSWGKDWGNEGYTKYYFWEWGAHWEIWTVVDIDQNNVYIPSPKKNCCLIL